MALDRTITTLLAPSLHSMGYRLVQAKLGDVGRRRTLSLLVDRLDGARIGVIDCEAVSHRASALLDVENIIDGAYDLEVGSPGIDRPLITREDFEAYLGFEAKAETEIPIAGRRRFKGKITTVGEDSITLEVDGQPCIIPLNNLHAAKLVLTDALIKRDLAV